MQVIKIESVKGQFPILGKVVYGKPLVYLDNAATSQKPLMVIEAIEKFYKEHNSNVHRGLHQLSEEATLLFEKAHQVVSDFINADFEEVIFTKNATEALNLVAYSYGLNNLKENDIIVLTQMEHHSNIVPWQQIAKKTGAVIKYVRITEDGRLDLNHLKELLHGNVKMVAFTYMSNVLGTINPVKEICSLVREKGGVSVVDAAQAAAHVKIDVKDIGCDFLAFSGHKMFGPTGIGMLYGRKELLESMEPFLCGGDMILEVSFEKSSWNELPWKFEAGTPHIAGAVGILHAIQFIQKIGFEAIAAHEKEVADYCLQKLKELEGITIYGPSERGPVISFSVAGIHPHDMATLLDKQGIAIRGGNHCAMPLMEVLGVNGLSRVSFSVYNTKDDVDILIEGIKKVQQVFQ